jgi:sialic acid synthase SpsE
MTGSPVSLLYCVSSYPAPLDEMNLAELGEGYYSGFSDHSDPAETITGALAVALGASVVEAHVRVPGQSNNLPDYTHAMEGPQFAEYVRLIRLTERVLGDFQPRKMRECERAMSEYRTVTDGASGESA